MSTKIKSEMKKDTTYTVSFFFSKTNSKPQRQVLPAHMCIPAILDALCFSHRALFLTCEKYGCRQFNPWPNNYRPEIYDSLDIFFS